MMTWSQGVLLCGDSHRSSRAPSPSFSSFVLGLGLMGVAL